MTTHESLKNVQQILFIDDDAEDALLFEAAVFALNKKIIFTSFTDAQRALDHLVETTIKPDVIILDINMPLITGFDCLKFLKANEHLCGIPVIVFTTSRQERDRDLCMTLGAYSFLSKPNSFFELDELVRSIFSPAQPSF